MTSPPTEEQIANLAREFGITEEAARALLGAVWAEANPPSGQVVTV